ncbi:MAG TPA: ABC transporter substrate-binding protein, partial [Casimicrobiaceae bacterium]|nr:ABC transporter substrate-binding protein [Casimicrobiaceae bacterium]
VTWPYTVPAQVALLRQRGIAVFVTAPDALGGIAADVVKIGELAGTEGAARTAARSIDRRLDALGSAARGKRNVRVFYQVADAPIYSIGGRHLITRAIELCGGTNVLGAMSIPAPQVGVEAVLAAAPEAIIAGTDNAARPRWLDAWRQWDGLPAVRYDNLYVVDANLLHRPGPRFAEGVEQLCTALDAARRRIIGR